MLDELQEPISKGQKDYWGIVRRRRWWFLAPCFLGWSIFLAVLYILPASYRSQATILVSGQSIPDKYVPSSVQSQIPQRLQAMTQQILSRTQLQRIIEDFHLYPEDRTKLGPDQLVERIRNDVEILPIPIDDLAQPSDSEDPAQAAKRALGTTPMGKAPDSLAFRLSYAAAKPRLAQQVADALVSLFIEANLAQRQRQAETTTSFLQSQVEEARNRLQEQEARVQQFKRRYLGQLPEQKESNMQILSALQSRLQAASDALNRAEQQKLYLESLSEEYKSLKTSLNQGNTSSVQSPAAIDKELERLRAQLTNLRGQYTDRYPDVRNLEEEIAQTEELKKQIDDQIRAAKAQPSDDNTMHPTSLAELQQLSPMLQVESQLKANRHEIENAQVSIERLEKEISGYQARLDQTPMREQELQSITRDYDQLRGNYESLLSKQNDSQVATNLERRQQGEQFVVLNPTDMPKKPNSPDRFKMGLIGLGVGLGLGLIVAVISEFADDRLHSDDELKVIVTAPILGGVSAILTSAEKASLYRRLRLEALSATLMVTMMAAGTAFTFYHG